MACPSCGSDDWKLASYVHKEGISSVATSTKGVGLGLGGGHLGVGVAKGNTRGVHQTALSKEAAPPKENSWGANLFFGVVVTGVLGIFAAWWWLVTALFVLGIFATWSSDSEKRNAQIAIYNKKRLCQRCGTFYFS